MSAIVCGKRSLFEETHPPTQKRLRCNGGGGGSPSRLPALRIDTSVIDPFLQLKALFPDMDEQLIGRVLAESGDNLDFAIKRLNELQLNCDGEDSSHLPNHTNASDKVLEEIGSQPVGAESSMDGTNQEAPSLVEGTKWVELFVQEMLSASNLDDAKERAARALEAFEKATLSRSGSLFEDLQKENTLLKEQLQCLLRDNHILKRAVAIQHERQVEHDNSSQELQQLKQLMAQYQEQIRNLEMNNYALNLHLRKAQEGSSIPGRFHPDVF